MSDNEELSDAPSGAIKILEVKSAEELATLVYDAIKALGDHPRSVECENALQFLAGTLSALQMQNMQMLAFIQYIQGWCHIAAGKIKMSAPWDFEVWSKLAECATAQEAREYLDKVGKERRKEQRHILLLDGK